VDNVPLARIATVTGVYGISFEIMLVNTAFAAAFLVHKERRKQLLFASLAAVAVLQAVRWLPAPAFPVTKTAYLVQANVPILEGSDWTKQYFAETLRELTQVSLNPASVNAAESSGSSASGAPHPDLIVWPESPAPFYTSDPIFRDAISDVAKTANTWVLVGSIGIRNASASTERPTEIYNSAALVNPTGEWTTRYDKVHLVPFGEYVPFEKLFAFASGLTKEVGTFSRGESRQALSADGSRLGAFICYESIFPDEIRQSVRDGAQVLVNVSNDGWYGDSGAYAQHLRQARMRAIENDRWLLRDTNTGVTSSIDPYGRVVAEIPRKIRATLVAPYALVNDTTFYTRHGDWFAYLCAIILVAALLRFAFPAKAKT
jgi:apolipoprotein N-acyltransferase